METVIEHLRIDDEFLNNNNDPMAIIAPVWWAATIYDGEEKYNESLAPFSKEQRNVYTLLWYLAEVENGGHDQFYFNSTGIVWKDALIGSKVLGLSEVAKTEFYSTLKISNLKWRNTACNITLTSVNVSRFCASYRLTKH